MTVYDLKLDIDKREKELQQMKHELRERCTHPKEFRHQEHRNNNPDPLQVEVRYIYNKCQLCGSQWKSDEHEIRR